MTHRQYQEDLKAAIRAAWAEGAVDVMPVLATGGGKTKIFTDMMAEEPGISVGVAHRQELVSQMSMAMARNGLQHRIIAPKNVIQTCVALHMAEFGRTFYNPTARAAAAGVGTLVRLPETDPLFQACRLVVTDESAHLLRDNSWGIVRARFKNARGLAPTATPVRADGKGLGRHADGFIDRMVFGPSMRDLIRMGYLADYKIYAPESNLNLEAVPVGSGGDYSRDPLVKAVSKSSVTGDVVEHYMKIAMGKLGVTFAVSVEEAEKITAAYRAAGVPAELVTGDTPDTIRADILRRFRARQVLQLVNCDLFGEGFDLPAIEVVSMARPTKSFGLYCQQFGRALRPMEGKTHAIIIDHVRNVESFARTRGLPDTPQAWTLDRRERSAKGAPSDAIPVRTCTGTPERPGCALTYERVLDCCPYCGVEPVLALRGSPAQVDGVLHELDPDVLRALRREVETVDGPGYVPAGLSLPAQIAAARRHRERQDAQRSLREALALWGGWQVSLGRSASEAQRAFWFRYGTDGMTAAALGAREAGDLEAKIRAQLSDERIIDALVNTEGTP